MPVSEKVNKKLKYLSLFFFKQEIVVNHLFI